MDILGSGTDDEAISHPPDRHVGSLPVGFVRADNLDRGVERFQKVGHPGQRITGRRKKKNIVTSDSDAATSLPIT